jgi:hypothetical protein
VTFVPAKGIGKFGSSSAKSATMPKRLDFLTFREEKFKKTGTRMLTGSQLSFITQRIRIAAAPKVSQRASLPSSPLGGLR